MGQRARPDRSLLFRSLLIKEGNHRLPRAFWTSRSSHQLAPVWTPLSLSLSLSLPPSLSLPLSLSLPPSLPLSLSLSLSLSYFSYFNYRSLKALRLKVSHFNFFYFCEVVMVYINLLVGTEMKSIYSSSARQGQSPHANEKEKVTTFSRSLLHAY